ncbi:28092_t:CDS:10 [Dentiscutata erythropus]|uniref:28092_t:CDS:1 n=1 Tax=Dentiscutata erythropus TaxID=1348616 RepID=A0A9N9I0G5_9GLOM|nr:28092_t:CDS:10 [Dentiscutata erythropus]
MSIKSVEKLLIANRGEIACRILQTCKRMGISTVAVYSDIEQNALFVKLADEAIHIGPPSAADSYLRGDKIIEAAKRVGADAIHPGYGFLSENAEFARNVVNSEIIFIGPTSESILAIGDKIEAKNLLAKHLPSVNLIPGYNGDIQNIDVLVYESKRIGFPVLLKASAGGGGKDRILIEKYFESIRHVERDCSIQRRHQKIIEETPSPVLDQNLRQNMIDAAIKIGKLLKYTSAGTVEFIVDIKENKYYFLEMNTRLQVEHPITEFITGLDLVELQILVSQGYDLSHSQLPTLKSNGHSIECRLYSEDPYTNFLPSIGKILQFKPYLAPNIRYDTGVETGSEISVYYDPLITKISVWAPTRNQALQKMRLTLQNTICLGLVTNQQFLLQVMNDPNFISGRYDTNFIEHQFSLSKNQHIQGELGIIPFLWLWYIREKQRTVLKHVPSGWRYLKYKNFTDEYIVHNGNNVQSLELEYEYHTKLDGGKIGNSGEHIFSIWIKGDSNKCKHVVLKDVIINENDIVYGSLRCSIDGIQKVFNIASKSQNLHSQEVYVHYKELGGQIKFIRNKKKFYNEDVEDDAPMPCKILKILVLQNSKISKNEAILTIESMKIETRIYSRHDGVVKLLVKEGDIVDAGTVLIKIEQNK